MQIISSKKWDALQMQVKALQTTNLMSNISFAAQIFPMYKEFSDAYEKRDMVYSIIRKLATNAAMIPFYGYDKRKDTDLPDTDKLVQFLTKLDFEQKEIMYTWLWAKGEVFMYKVKLDLGVNAGLNRLVFLNPSKITLVLSADFPTSIVRYRYTDAAYGFDFDIELEDMVFIKFPNTSCDEYKSWRGLAPTDVLTGPLTVTTSGDDATVAQLQNGGVPSIVYDKTPNLEVGALGSRKDTFGRFLRNPSNKGAPYFAAGEMGVLQLGSKLVDMDVTALMSVSFDRIYNVFGVSKVLFNDTSASTESNVQEMVKEMFTNTIIPNVTRVEAALNKGVVPDIKTAGTIRADFGGIKALQDDEVKKSQALAAKWWTSGNEKRTEDGYDQIMDNPMMNQIIVPSGFALLSDLDIQVEDIVPTEGDVQPPKQQATVLPIKRAING